MHALHSVIVMTRLHLLVPALCVPLLVGAQSPDSLPKVVVTATRVDVPLGTGITATTVVDRLTIERSGVRDVAEALRLVPGLSVARSEGPGSQTSVFLRGGENDYVRVLVDGVPVNDPGGAVDFGWLPVADVERIEVVRGPASVLYGTDAVSGVIQVFTRRATARAATMELRGGRYGARSSQGTLALGQAHAGVLFGASREHGDGLLPFNNQYDRTTLTGSAHVAPDVATQASLVVRAVNDEFHYPTDGAGNADDRNAFRHGDRVIASGALQRRLTSNVRAELSVGFLDSRNRDDDRADSPADTVGFYHYDAATTMRRRVVDARLHWTFSPTSMLTLGTESARESQRGNDSSNYSFERGNFSAERATTAFYAQWLAEAGRLSLTAGGRYDDNDTYGAFRTWRSGIAWRAWSGATFRASWSSAFKAPTFLETFNTAFTTGNPALVPEQSRSWEAGVRQLVGSGRVELAASWFDQRFRDMIQYAFVDVSQPNYFNVAEATARGLELEASGQATSRVRASVSTSIIRTRVVDEGLEHGEGATFVRGKRLLRRPSVTASGGVVVALSGQASMDLVARYTGTRDDRDFGLFPAEPVVLPAYSRVDLGFAGPAPSSWSGGDVRIRLRLENLFGTAYQEVFGFPAPGRVLSIGLRVGAG